LWLAERFLTERLESHVSICLAMSAAFIAAIAPILLRSAEGLNPVPIDSGAVGRHCGNPAGTRINRSPEVAGGRCRAAANSKTVFNGAAVSSSLLFV